MALKLFKKKTPDLAHSFDATIKRNGNTDKFTDVTEIRLRPSKTPFAVLSFADPEKTILLNISRGIQDIQFSNIQFIGDKQ